MHPIIVGELGRQRREGFDREVERAALLDEARAYREARRAAANAARPTSHHPSWTHLLSTLVHPHLPHRPAH